MISIVVATFNASTTIDRCLNSILAAKKNHAVELIVINDGSEDGTAEILQKWVGNEPWIIVRHQENGGESSARNSGLDLATGDYIVFVDSDDTIDDWYFDFVVEKAIVPEVDMLVFGHKRIELDGTIIERKNISAEYSVEDIAQLQLRVTENRNIYWLGCTRVFSRHIIGDLRFDLNVKLGTDVIFIINCLNEARNMSVVCDCPYNYYENSNSLTSSQYKPNLLESVEALYNARVEAQKWPADSIEKEVLESDIARSIVEHMLPFLLNNIRYTTIGKRRAELVKIRQSFIYKNCLPNYSQRHPLSRGVRLLILSFSRRWYVLTLGLLQLSWSKK